MVGAEKLRTPRKNRLDQIIEHSPVPAHAPHILRSANDPKGKERKHPHGDQKSVYAGPFPILDPQAEAQKQRKNSETDKIPPEKHL